jgi:MFS family permease
LALVSLPVFIGALDLTIVSAVLPNVIVDLHIPLQTNADDAAWIVSGYLLAYTVSVAVMGRVSDLMGRRRTYFLALLIFILGSWLVATAAGQPTQVMYRLFRLLQGGRPDRAYMTLYALIAGRVIQAFGAGAMVPVTMALVGDLYPPGKRATPLGVVGAIDTAGWVLGSLYGGVMVQLVHWTVLFWINIPITAIVALLTWRSLKGVADAHEEGGSGRAAGGIIWAGLGVANVLALGAIVVAIWPSLASIEEWIGNAVVSVVCAIGLLAALALTLAKARRKAGAGQADWLGTLLMALCLTGLNIGLGAYNEDTGAAAATAQTPSPSYAVPILAASAVVLAIFVWVESRTDHPLFRLSNFRDRNVSLAVSTNLLVGFCLMVGLVSVPLFINVLGTGTLDEKALTSGILLGALTIPMALASVPGGLLTDRLGYRVTTLLGLAIAAGGFYLGCTWAPETPETTMAMHLALAGIGLGLTIAPIGTAVINAVHATEHGIAAALVLIMRLIGMTVGTSLMTTYGLRRLAYLINAALAGSETLDPNQIYAVTIEATTRVINEMYIIAAVVCLAALAPAVFLRPGDRITGTPS